MTIIVRRPWTRQPQGPVEVDWNNPLANGLVFAWTASSSRRNAASNSTATSIGSTLRAIAAGNVARNPNSSTIAFLPNSSLNVLGHITVASFAAFGDGGDRYLIANSSGNGATNTPFAFGYAGSIGISFARANTGFRVWTSGTNVVPVAGEFALLSVSQTNNISVNPRFYKNGVFDTATPVERYQGGGTGEATANTNNVLLFNRNDNATPHVGLTIFVAVWNRVLLDAEHAELSRNYWRLFAPRRIIIPVGAAAPTTFIPSWARQNSRVIGGGV